MKLGEIYPPPRGLCTHPEYAHINFFPQVDKITAYIRLASLAMSVCEKCSDSKKCLQYALDHDVRHGVWGGTIPAERRKMIS